MAESDLLTGSDARHLLRRATFGPSTKEVKAFTGLTRGEAADRLLGYRPSGFVPRGKDHVSLHNRWLRYMIGARSGLQEKLTLFWHDHFATGIEKVNDPEFMGVQNGLFRTRGKGNFKELVNAVHRDPAMVDWLDTHSNRKEDPNENYARELMELFTLGVFDFAGKANYAEKDVAQIARAFTGWQRVVFSQGGQIRRGGVLFQEFPHEYYFSAGGAVDDPYDRGPKVLFETLVDQVGPPGDIPVEARTWAPDRAAEGAVEIDAITDLLFLHRDSQGYNTVARRTAKRLIEYFAHPEPSTAFVDDVVALSGFAADGTWSIAALLKQVFAHDDFYPSTHPGKPLSVKWPIDYLVQSLRVAHAKTSGKEAVVGRPVGEPAFTLLEGMGQILFDPPSVFGWDWETGWVSTSGVLARGLIARGLLWDLRSLRPEREMDLSRTDPGEIVDAAADVLAVRGHLAPEDRAVLVDFLSAGGTEPVLDLKNDPVAYARLRELFALILQSPAYQLH